MKHHGKRMVKGRCQRRGSEGAAWPPQDTSGILGLIRADPLFEGPQSLPSRLIGATEITAAWCSGYENAFMSEMRRSRPIPLRMKCCDGPKHKVAALQPAAREQEPRGRYPVERTAIAGWQVNMINKRTVDVATDDQARASILTRLATSAALITR